ncbi:uncharacterized protein LOC129288148 isoform X2 [Prosopis cineraria]|uniref:uncharacterized protein LOC129288148 isoform X2 n=1 Tax=Prosopis cineraria TaxID=364024 RepID=UPI00240F0637|nr:uncharacterized protein LOC129288148 isoform X2 [Prosopis cineraria]
MIVAMDLNASPVPEEDDDIFERHIEEYIQPEERIETAVDIARREREERKRRLKRERTDDRPAHVSQSTTGYDQTFHAKFLKSYDKSRLPPGWLDCPSFGQEIYCLIPSKVPLGESFNDCIAPGRRYSFKQVIHQQRVLGRKLGLVIDLTNTTRYYPVLDLKKEGIKHIKIQCKGRDSVPDNLSVNQFVHEVTQFLSRQKQAKKYILVHCTHGHNRTGYMIVHYLMRTMSMSVTQAIKLFSEARPPGIYKPDYIDALYTFYHEKKPEMVVCPPTPEWKRSSEFDLNGEAMPDDDDDGVPCPPQENHETDAVMTNDDVLGDEIPLDQQDGFRQFCYQSLKLNFGARGHSHFPGSHPVSLNRENLQLLRQRYYYATWKADGTRYMMLITMDGCYLIDRSFNFRRVQMRFPCRGSNDGLAEKTHHYTLLDGEMIIDTLPDSQKQERRYLIYDMIAINHVSVIESDSINRTQAKKPLDIYYCREEYVVAQISNHWYTTHLTFLSKRPFYERWKMLEKEVIEPRNQERHNTYQSRNPYYRYDLEPFRVRRKDFWLLSTVTKLLNEFIKKLSHDADGLIFQIDDDHQSLFLHERGKKKLMEGNRVAFRDGSDPLLHSGKIIECSWDLNEQEWVYMRTRTDKSTPNDFNTYKKVMRSIKDNITEDVLLNEIYEIIRLPMYADRIKNESKAHQHVGVARRR